MSAINAICDFVAAHGPMNISVCKEPDGNFQITGLPLSPAHSLMKIAVMVKFDPAEAEDKVQRAFSAYEVIQSDLKDNLDAVAKAAAAAAEAARASKPAKSAGKTVAPKAALDAITEAEEGEDDESPIEAPATAPAAMTQPKSTAENDLFGGLDLG
jgi:membrane protein involved in colicin uptake